ncbi:MAG: hypothetical protein J6Z27_00060 [Bacteroidales bacterium]|nr:hypothetical protein [Bacteroidales bacterium]
MKTAQKIQSSLLELLKTKELRHITVSELSKMSRVSRNSFYRLFDTTTDVLVYACDTLSEDFVKIDDYIEGGKMGPFIDNYLRYLIDHSDILEAVYTSARPDILETSMLRIKTVKYPGMSDSPTLEYINGLSCAASISILMIWIRRGKRETPEELHKIFTDVFADKLFN